MFLLFDTEQACIDALDLITLAGKQLATAAGYTIALVDGVETIVAKGSDGEDRPQAAGTIRWDIPHEAANGAGWWCACPYAAYPEMEDMINIESVPYLPDGWEELPPA